MQREITEGPRWLERLEIGVVDGPETEEMLGALSRARFDDTPQAALNLDFSHALVARSEAGFILGVCGMSPPGSPVSGLCKGHDPYEHHWHLGPLAVRAPLQGRGVEDRLMLVACARIDAARDHACVETSRPERVRFYGRYGFDVVDEHEVLGVNTYLMVR